MPAEAKDTDVFLTLPPTSCQHEKVDVCFQTFSIPSSRVTCNTAYKKLAASPSLRDWLIG